MAGSPFHHTQKRWFLSANGMWSTRLQVKINKTGALTIKVQRFPFFYHVTWMVMFEGYSLDQIKMNKWIWPKNWQWQTLTCELDWKYYKYYHNNENEHVNMTEIRKSNKFYIFWSYSHVHVRRCGNIYYIFVFRSNSSTFWSSSQFNIIGVIFRLSSNVKVCHFRSNSNQFLVVLVWSS